jgi:hypothetical protein
MKFGVNLLNQLHNYILKTFPKLCDVITDIDFRKEDIKISINKPEFDDYIYVSYRRLAPGKPGESTKYCYNISTKYLNSKLNTFQEQYEENVKIVTEAKFKYRMLRVLIQPFCEELDEELTFTDGYISTNIYLKYKRRYFYINTHDLLESVEIEELKVYSNDSENWCVGIPVYEFINNPGKCVAKLKLIEKEMTASYQEYKHKRDEINEKCLRILRAVHIRYETELEQLKTWKEN